MMKFLKDKKGESLIETLAAILIFTMASIALFTMVTTAVRLNREAKETDALIQEQLVAAESAENITGTGSVSMTFLKPDGTKIAVSSSQVNVYGGTTDEAGERSLYSYFKKKP